MAITLNRNKFKYKNPSGSGYRNVDLLEEESKVNDVQVNGTSVVTSGVANIDLSGKADKTDTVLETTLSGGRKANTTVGTRSIAFGNDVEADGSYSQAVGNQTSSHGLYSHAEGNLSSAMGNSSHVEGDRTNTMANANASHAEGSRTTAIGTAAHAEGSATIARDTASHSEGLQTSADKVASHAEGLGTKSVAAGQHVEGKMNAVDSYDNWPEWTPNTQYEVGDKVKITSVVDGVTTVTGYVCKVANNDAEFNQNPKWMIDVYMNYLHIAGNGVSTNQLSNAYALDWDGNGHFAGDVYVHANSDSSGGTKLATEDIIAPTETVVATAAHAIGDKFMLDGHLCKATAAIAIGDTIVTTGAGANAEVTNLADELDNGGAVSDVQVNGVSVLDQTDGIANIPLASDSDIGVVQVDEDYGITANSSGYLLTVPASEDEIRDGDVYKPVTPINQHASTFYGLASAAGDLTQAMADPEDYPVGAYTDEAKAAIQQMLDVPSTEGEYDSLTAGKAKQLVSTVGIEDRVPYNFRTSGGSIDIGEQEVDKIIGGTVAWNQMIENGDFSDGKQGWGCANGTIDAANGILSYTVNNVRIQNQNRLDTGAKRYYFTNGHKYFVTWSVKTPYVQQLSFNGYSTAVSNVVVNSPTQMSLANEWYAFETVVASLYSTLSDMRFGVHSCEDTAVGDVSYFKNINVIDLTQMFGFTIADYIYSLEQATAGAGVAWFRKYFPKPFYAYNAGEFMSVKTNGHKTVGFNAWDEEWELGRWNPAANGEYEYYNNQGCSKNLIPVVPGAKYSITTPISSGISHYTMQILYYDADGNFIKYRNWSDSPFIVPENCWYIKFNLGSYGATYNHDICINLSWDGERDGEYEPYEENVYSLDGNLILKGIPRLDSNNDLSYWGDEYAEDGTVTRNVLEYTVTGEESLIVASDSYIKSDATNAFFTISSVPSGIGTNTIQYARCNQLAVATTSMWSEVGLPNTFILNTSANSRQIHLNIANELLGITDYTQETRETAKTKIAAYLQSLYNNSTPIKLILPIETPTTESADPYTNPQVVNDFGTEQYIDERTIPIPVGHETLYLANLRAKLEMAPNSPDGDGDYILRQSNGENEYVPFTAVNDVKVNGSTVVANGVANVPLASASVYGVIRVHAGDKGLAMGSGYIGIYGATDADIKAGGNGYRPITSSKQHSAAFYGLAKAAGDPTQRDSANAVGTYTETAKSAINSMLNAPEAVSGTTPTIVAKAGVQYICGEVSTIDFTPSAMGVCDVVFTSGSTPAVLTVPNTVKFPAWFDPDNLDADTTYEINILNGVYGAVMAWA